MKLHLPKKLLAAVLSCVYAATLPLATTVGTGALVAIAATYTAKAAEQPYASGGSYTLSEDTTFTGIQGNSTAATVDANGHNVTLQAAATNTMVTNFVTLSEVNNLSLSQGRYQIDEDNDFDGVSGNINICGAQVWFNGNGNNVIHYTGSDAITQNMTISGGTFAEGNHLDSLNYSALRIGADVEIKGLLTIAASTTTRPAKISFQNGKTLTLSGGISGMHTLLLGVYSGNNTLNVTGSTTSFSGLLEFQDFRADSLTVTAGSANGLHVGGIAGNNGALGLASGSTTAALTLDVAENQSHSFAGTIANGYSIVKTGAGTQTFTNRGNTLSGSIAVQGGTLVYDGMLQNTDGITLTNDSTLTLGGTANITSQINNAAGTLVLKDGVVLRQSTDKNIIVASEERFIHRSYEETEVNELLSRLATDTTHVTVEGNIVRDLSIATFQSGSILVIGDGQTVASAPNIEAGASITLEVGAGHTGTWSAAAQPSGDSAGYVSTVNVGSSAHLTVGAGGDLQYAVFARGDNKTQTINLASNSTLTTLTSLAGWQGGDAATVVNMKEGSTWNIRSSINDDCEYMNETTINMENATIDIASGKFLRVERNDDGHNAINVYENSGTSRITGQGAIRLQNHRLNFGVATDESGAAENDPATTPTLSIEVAIVNGVDENGNPKSHGIQKSGDSVLELTNGDNTYSAGTTVNGGTLRLAGEGGTAGAGAITVAADATLELAHSVDRTITNNIALNGNLVLSSNVQETLSGNITGTLQHVTLSAGATLGLSGAGASMSIGSSQLTMGENSGFYLANNASLTLGTSADRDRVDEFLGTIGGDGTGRLRLNLTNDTAWGFDKLVVLGEDTKLAGVYLDSGYLAISTSSHPDAPLTHKNTATNLQKIDLHMADGTSLIVTNTDSKADGIGNIHITGTGGIFQYDHSSVTFKQNFLKEEGAGRAVLKTYAGGGDNGGTVTITGNVTLDSILAEKGTLNLTGDLSLSGALTATQGALNVSGSSNVIGGKLTIGNKDNANQSANVVFNSYATINGGILVDRGTLTFKAGAKLSGTLDLSNDSNANGHIVVSGGTVTNNGTIWSSGSDNYIELQGSGKFIHENIEYSVRSDLAEGEHTRLYTAGNETIGIAGGTHDQKTVISKAAINVLSTNEITITAQLDDVDITHQAGGAMSFADKTKEIRSLLDYSGHGITNSAALTVTGTLSLSGTLTLTGTGSLTFNADNLVLDHGMSGFATLDGNPSGYSNGDNGYIQGNQFVIIDASASTNDSALTVNGILGGGLSLSREGEAGNKVIYTVGSDQGSDNTYYINADANYSSVVWREGGENDLVLVTDGHTLTLDRDFDSTHRLATASGGWVALGNGVTVTNFGQTPADVNNIKVKTGESATISGSMAGMRPVNTSLESNSTLTVESGTDAFDFGNLTLAEGSTLSTARNISATLASAAADTAMGTVHVDAGATAVLNLSANSDDEFMNVAISGTGTIELHNNSWDYVNFTSANNAFNGTLKVLVSGRYITFGKNGTGGSMQTFAEGATPGLVLEGGDGTHGIILKSSYAGTDADPTTNAMRIGSLSSESEGVTIRGDIGDNGKRYIAVSQSDNTTFAGLFMNDPSTNNNRSVGLVMNGTGNLTLTNANTSTAGLYINTGTVTLGGEKGAWAGAINVADDATLAYAGAHKVLANTQNITFTGVSTLKVESGTELTLQKAITANAASLSIAEGGKLVLGEGGSWSGKYVGKETSTVVISKTGSTQIAGNTAWAGFKGTLDVAKGSVYVGAAEGSAGGADATLGASKVVVRNGASFITHFGQSSPKAFDAAIYTESGAKIGNKDGYANWTGKIYLNMAGGSTPGDTIQYNSTGETEFNLHWDKEVTWSGSIYGSGTLNITTSTQANPRYLILSKNQDQAGAFNGTYKLTGNTSNWTELRLNGNNAAKGAKINLSAGQVRLGINTDNAVIAELSGNAGEVYAVGGNRTLTIQQSDDSTFAGVIKDNGSNKFSVTKEGVGNLTLSGNNTYSGATTVNGGTLRLAGEGGKAGSAAITVEAGATLELAHTQDYTTTNDITLNGNLLVSGSAKETLSGSINGQGNLTVTDGTLKVTGSISNTSSAAVSGDGVLEISGENASVTVDSAMTARANSEQGGTARNVTITTTNSEQDGTVTKNVTIAASGSSAATSTSGEGGALQALGEMTGLTLAFAAENTAAEISNVTLQDVTLNATGGTVTYSNAKAVAATAGPAVAPVLYAATATEMPETLTAMDVQQGGTAKGTLTIDVTHDLLRANAGEDFKWTIFDGVSSVAGENFTLKLGDILKTIVDNGKPTVTLSGDWVSPNESGENSLVLTSGNLVNLHTGTGGLLAGSVTSGNLMLTIENVPEPTTGTLSVLALAALAARRRRRK